MNTFQVERKTNFDEIHRTGIDILHTTLITDYAITDCEIRVCDRKLIETRVLLKDAPAVIIHLSYQRVHLTPDILTL